MQISALLPIENREKHKLWTKKKIQIQIIFFKIIYIYMFGTGNGNV